MELPTKIQEQIDIYDEQIEVTFSKKEYRKIIDIELKKWDILPDKKETWDESFHIAKSLVDEYLRINNISSAKEWSEILFNCDLERIDDGEREFVAGRANFESKEFSIASKYFKIADEKSEGYAFEDEDPKYLDFHKNPEKYK
jgi:hypothetical protein